MNIKLSSHRKNFPWAEIYFPFYSSQPLIKSDLSTAYSYHGTSLDVILSDTCFIPYCVCYPYRTWYIIGNLQVLLKQKIRSHLG